MFVVDVRFLLKSGPRVMPSRYMFYCGVETEPLPLIFQLLNFSRHEGARLHAMTVGTDFLPWRFVLRRALVEGSRHVDCAQHLLPRWCSTLFHINRKPLEPGVRERAPRIEQQAQPVFLFRFLRNKLPF